MSHPPQMAVRLQRLAVAVAVLAFAGLAVAAAATDRADSASVRVLGAAAPAQPSCNPKSCVVEARVTGFQTRIGKTAKPFVAPFPGRIVAWSIKLGRPSARDRDCLANGCRGFAGLGGPAKARLAILRPVRNEIKKGRPIYRLVAQSPVEELAPYFGTTTTFTLERPLRVARGNIAALTIPTWAPVFAAGMGARNLWRASRRATKKRGKCSIQTPSGPAANLKAGSPQLKVSSQRFYGCRYRGNRLLYSATLVRRPGS